MATIRIVWNGKGGELDSVEVKGYGTNTADDTDTMLTEALIKLVKGNIVSPGDSFTITED